MKKTINLPTEHYSEQIARQFAACLEAPAVLTFSGEIGAGKTTFIRAMLRSLGVQSTIKSPTFSLVESYQGTSLQIHHFDLYRIHDETELDYIGFRDYFRNNAVCCIEWPERAMTYLAKPDIQFTLTMEGAGRAMQLQAFSTVGNKMLSCLLGG
jgi:tRNA threonylcarbamoyladenosine biosynthesis protein TsaE